MEGTLLYQYGGYGAASLVQLCLYDETSCLALGIGLKLQHICGEQYHLKELVDALSGLGGNRCEYGGTAPVLSYQIELGKLLLHPVHICAGLVYLVHGNDYLDAGCLGMVYCLYSLGHNAVVRSHHQYGDIRGIGTTHTHGGECLMTRCIQEGDGTSVDGNGVSTYMLGYAAGFLVGDMGLPDGIQE